MTLDFKVWIDKAEKFNNDELLPDSIRALLIGSSNSGKTTLLFRMLLQPGFLDYDNLYIFSKSLHQPEYKILLKGFMNGLGKKDIIQVFEIMNRLGSAADLDTVCQYLSGDAIAKGGITVSAFNSNTTIPDPTQLDSAKKNLIIFDDVIFEKQDKISDYYTRGRHNNTQCFYISQAFMKIPKFTVREDANLIILFKLTDKDVKNVFDTYIASDMTYKEFKLFCSKVWSESFNFVVIDRFNSDPNWRYRKGFETPFDSV